MNARVLEPIIIGQIVQLTFGPLGNAQLSRWAEKGEPAYGAANRNMEQGETVDTDDAVSTRWSGRMEAKQ